MAEKVKVSREVAGAIEYALQLGTKGDLLIYHISNFNGNGTLKDGATWSSTEYLPLNRLSPEQLAIALYVGYEIEKTPEEKLAERYENLLLGKTIFDFEEGKSVAYGIKEALQILGITIDGINGGEQDG